MQRTRCEKAAKMYYALGWNPIPLKAFSKEPNVTELAPFLESRIGAEDIPHYEWRNIAIATGNVSGLVVLDVDSEEGRLHLKEKGHPPTPMVSTAKGLHLYFRYPVSEVPTSIRFSGGLDLKADGGYVVAPPSHHPSGQKYEWIEGLSPRDVELSELPVWIRLEIIDGKTHQKKLDPDLLSHPLAQGNRNEIMTSVAGALRARGLDRESLYVVLKTLNETRCDPPLPEVEIVRITNNISRYPPALTTRKDRRRY